ncbi:type II secretion system protein GspD [Methylomonas lenta]|uniref:Type II secretion system protein GspD n=1 Tax=Methylomonas lenta TaxID=980561 RepID=A0A177MWL4_9GAMM|nr:type II secretion system secretin GspD [Methylomonas lenta]OAI10086.1 type II secretion system protein GspD [Methylomonas lenta]
MIVKSSKPLQILALALMTVGCEFISPQLHDKIPLPQAKPLPEDLGIPLEPEVDTKTTKVEIFPSDESSINNRIRPTTAKTSGGKGEYSLNFDDADLGEVAKVILSDILGKNYTLSPQVSGKVTLQTTQPLSKDDLIPTLEMLLSVNNAALVVESGLYVIKPSNEAMYSSTFKSFGSSSMPSGYQTRVIPVRNVAAGEIAEILKPMLPEKSQLSVDANRNILLASGSAGELNRIQDFINTFDVDVLKGRSFALFTPAHVDASKIIEELEPIFNRVAEGDKTDKNSFFRFIEIERLNAILAITHNPRYLNDIESWVLRLDRTRNDISGGVNVYRAQNVSAVELANTLSNIFGTSSMSNSRSASIASGRRSMSVSNSSSNSSNSSSNSGSSSGSSGSSTGTSGTGGMNSTLSNRNQQTGGSNSINSNTFGSGGVNNNSEMAKVKIIPDEGNNALVIVADSEEYTKILHVIKQLDVLPLQVLIDATIVEVTLKDELQYGIQWFFSHNNGGANEISGGDGGISMKEIGKGIMTGGLTYAFASDSGDIKALLSANASKNNINVISSPSLMVLNNQEASIKVGDSVPIRTSESTNTNTVNNVDPNAGVVVTSGIQMVDTGINLSIRPRVNSGGLVLMDILQTVNQATQTTALTGGSNIDSPTIQKREVESSVVIQSGETIVLGGLIREENTNNKNGVPILYDIPYIGPLFGGTTRNKNKSELVVLITPRVVNTRQDAQLITDEFRRKLSSIYEIPPTPSNAPVY